MVGEFESCCLCAFGFETTRGRRGEGKGMQVEIYVSCSLARAHALSLARALSLFKLRNIQHFRALTLPSPHTCLEHLHYPLHTLVCRESSQQRVGHIRPPQPPPTPLTPAPAHLHCLPPPLGRLPAGPSRWRLLHRRNRALLLTDCGELRRSVSPPPWP